jgi:hypothetical protein
MTRNMLFVVMGWALSVYQPVPKAVALALAQGAKLASVVVVKVAAQADAVARR